MRGQCVQGQGRCRSAEGSPGAGQESGHPEQSRRAGSTEREAWEGRPASRPPPWREHPTTSSSVQLPPRGRCQAFRTPTWFCQGRAANALSRLGDGGLVTSHLVVTSEKSPFCPKTGGIFLQDPRIAKKHWFLGTDAKSQSLSAACVTSRFSPTPLPLECEDQFKMFSDRPKRKTGIICRQS